MYDAKIFQDIEGIFSWINAKKKKDDNKSGQYNKNHEKMDDMIIADNPADTLKELLEFINVEVTPDEFEALGELLNIKAKKNITYEDIYNLFVKDEHELERERDKLIESFRFLTLDQKSDEIDLDRLKMYLKVYEKKYNDSYETLISDPDAGNYIKDKKFYFKEYLNSMYKSKGVPIRDAPKDKK